MRGTSAFMADPLRHLAAWNQDRRAIRQFEPGRYVVADGELIRDVLASTTTPFEAKAATFGAVADWIPGSERTRPLNAALAKELDRAWHAVSPERITEELERSAGEPWPTALSGLYLRLFKEQLFPGLTGKQQRLLRQALDFSNRLDRDDSTMLQLRRRIAHSQAEAALYDWAAGRQEPGDIQEAMQRVVNSMDEVALLLHGLVGALCRATAMVMSWAALLDCGWTLGMPTGTTLKLEEPVHPAEYRVREALRLWPVAWLISRKVTQATTLSGTTLTPEDRLFLCTYLLHRDPDVWQDPDEYRPGRWENPPVGYKSVYLPFGFGAAACVGSRFVSQATARVLECWSALPDQKATLLTQNPAMGSLLAPPVFKFN
ncbi:cytochrome P450 [Kibdelosporangium aridum]|uniref:Cytochrome P450 n=1 Tax=Kibdelosporangium aridum TaxID=2030 RepID=A0A428ZUL4_KIBAR|nr:cytochrome P450 [Kibdelosporangium aridum]RSM91760.1 cytochrome P450 [Kibdelosporangium aridum]